MPAINCLDAKSEIYGNDVNSILKEIMGVTDRNPMIAELFSRFNSLLEDKKYDEAETVLDEIDVQAFSQRAVSGIAKSIKSPSA